MNKHLYRTGLFVSCALAILALNGCVSVDRKSPYHDFISEAPAPRPFTKDVSYAMQKMYSEFNTFSPRTLGSIADTAIWEDEVGTVLGGFDPKDVLENTIGSAWTPSLKEENQKNLMKKYGTVPGNLRTKFVEEDNSVQQFTGAAIIAGAPRNMVVTDTSLNFTPGGVALGLGLWLLTSTEEDKARDFARDQISEFNLINIAYRLTPEEQVTLEGKGLLPPTCKEDAGKLADYYAEKILLAMGESIKELGYYPVGEIVKYKPENARTGMYHLAMEGNHCPKANTQEPWKSCSLRVSNTKNYDKTPHAIRLGKNNAPVANFPFDYDYEPMLFLPWQTFDLHRKVTDDLAMTMAKKYENITFFFPAEEKDGKWLPQRVVDSKGTHYFVVPVKREGEKP